MRKEYYNHEQLSLKFSDKKMEVAYSGDIFPDKEIIIEKAIEKKQEFKTKFLDAVLQLYNSTYEEYLNASSLQEIDYNQADEYDLDEMFTEFLPKFSKSEDIEQYLNEFNLYKDAKHKNLFVISFLGRWDEEHELYIVFENDTLIFAGYDLGLFLVNFD